MARLYNIVQFLDDAGDPLNGGKIYTYITNTSTNKATYQDQAEGTAHANPIVLDSDGRPPGGAIFLLTDENYRFIIRTAADVLLQTIDDVSGTFSPTSEAYDSHNLKLQAGRGLLDNNGNEVLLIGETASAVNEVTVTNAETGNAVSVSATGDDSNIEFNIVAKGTSAVSFTSNSKTITLPTDTPVVGEVITATSTAGATEWASPVVLGYGHLSGLELAQDTDEDHDIAISVGACRDSSDTVVMALSSTLTKRIDAAWAAGDDAGGLPSPLSLTADTWYHIFIIEHTDGTTDAGFDTSFSATNLLAASSYTYYRYLGSVLTDASANIIDFIQDGDYFIWKAPTLDVDTTSLSTTRTNYTIAVPPDIRARADLRVHAENAAEAHVVIANPELTDSAPSATAAPLSDIHVEAGVVDVINMSMLTNTVRQISARSDAASTTLRVAVIGYMNKRGK